MNKWLHRNGFTYKKPSGTPHKFSEVSQAGTGCRLGVSKSTASWERGLNENSNGLLRQYIPKGTDLTAVTDDEHRKYQGALNSSATKMPGIPATFSGLCRVKTGDLALHSGVESAT